MSYQRSTARRSSFVSFATRSAMNIKQEDVDVRNKVEKQDRSDKSEMASASGPHVIRKPDLVFYYKFCHRYHHTPPQPQRMSGFRSCWLRPSSALSGTEKQEATREPTELDFLNKAFRWSTACARLQEQIRMPMNEIHNNNNNNNNANNNKENNKTGAGCLVAYREQDIAHVRVKNFHNCKAFALLPGSLVFHEEKLLIQKIPEDMYQFTFQDCLHHMSGLATVSILSQTRPSVPLGATDKLRLFAYNCQALHQIHMHRTPLVPLGYVCRNCHEEGHFRSQCPRSRRNKRADLAMSETPGVINSTNALGSNGNSGGGGGSTGTSSGYSSRLLVTGEGTSVAPTTINTSKVKRYLPTGIPRNELRKATMEEVETQTTYLINDTWYVHKTTVLDLTKQKKQAIVLAQPLKTKV